MPFSFDLMFTGAIGYTMLEIMLTTARRAPTGNALLDLLTNTAGLSVNGGGEAFAAANQQTTPGDGKLYMFVPDPQGRKIKSITANFRYTANTGALTALFFMWVPGSDWSTRLGLYDEWNGQAGFRLVSDLHAQALTTASFNGVLTRTFATPIPQDELGIKIGGRTGLTYSPAYIKDIVFTYE
jgi:hypothetical protein